MLSRNLRVNFKESRGIWRIFRKTPDFLVKIKPSPSVCFAVTAGVKVSKQSSRRNLLKRRVRGFILRNIGKFKTVKPQYYWITIFPPAHNLTKQEFIRELGEVLFKN